MSSLIELDEGVELRSGRLWALKEERGWVQPPHHRSLRGSDVIGWDLDGWRHIVVTFRRGEETAALGNRSLCREVGDATTTTSTSLLL